MFVEENPPTQLVAINTPSSPSSSNAATPKSPSSSKKTVDIVVGVVVPVIFVVVILAFCLFFRLKRRLVAKRPKSVHSVQVQPIPNSPPVGSEELDAEKTAIHELSGFDRRRQHGQANSLTHAPENGDRRQGEEFIASRGGLGISPSEPLLDSVHEVQGSQTTPYELAADTRSEMPGAPVTRKASSGGASSLNRRWRSFLGSSSRRSSRQGSIPTPGSPASAGGEQTTTTTTNRQSMTASPPQEGELFSPISPLVDGETAGPAGLNAALIRNFSQSSRSSRRTPKVTQEKPDGDIGVI